jgi:hypothetical protein
MNFYISENIGCWNGNQFLCFLAEKTNGVLLWLRVTSLTLSDCLFSHGHAANVTFLRCVLDIDFPNAADSVT